MKTTELSDPNMNAVRFAFGKNWTDFLSHVNKRHVEAAVERLYEKLGDLNGKRLLDIGSGSGLHSLAAVLLGARVHSFDYDESSVACTAEMKRRFAPDADWTVEQGSALDADYLRSLGTFDVVYSWGVLHHTGDMWKALDFAALPLVPEGRLFIAIYNDQGAESRRWKALKRRYVTSGILARKAIEAFVWYEGWGRFFVRDVATLRPLRTYRQHRTYVRQRGMSPWHDVVDWAGGYPFEVATPEAIFDFYRERGFSLTALKTCGGGKGCNEFVFQKDANR